jgi:CMP-N,N'-diacetyllegionaminic acid synthase
VALNKASVLAIIPARGGSKGIVDKNLKLFRGKKLIQYTLESVQESKLITETIVSTDSRQILEFCSEFGFDAGYIRPAELASDESKMTSAISHVLDWLESKHSKIFDYFIILQPTSPLRTAGDIDAFINFMIAGNHKTALSVHEMREHPMESIKVSNSDSWEYLVRPPSDAYGRQEYDGKFLFINGALYGSTTVHFKTNAGFLDPNSARNFFEIPRSRGLEIDYQDDLLV